MATPNVASCNLEGGGSCRLLISPFPVPIPKELRVSANAAERRVKLIDSRKPNSLKIMQRVGELLRQEGVEVDELAAKKNVVGAEDPTRYAEFMRHKGLIVLGVFD